MRGGSPDAGRGCGLSAISRTSGGSQNENEVGADGSNQTFDYEFQDETS
jgi:hypothetical protein